MFRRISPDVSFGPGAVLVALAVLAAGCGTESTAPTPSTSIQPRPLVFASDRDGDFDLYAMIPDGTDVVQLTNAPGDDLTPRWSPDGRLIAFASNRGGTFAVYVMRADGTDQVRLRDGSRPAWSPDGRSLAFVNTARISIMSSNGTGSRTVAAIANVDGLDWEPNGNRIAFGYPDPVFSGFEVKTEVVNADGTNREAFLIFSTLPRWSPDGGRLVVYQRSNSFRLDQIAVIPLGGQTVQIETAPVTRPPAWSPDGTQVLFTKLALTDGVVNEEIFVASASGAGAPVQLTSHIGNDRDPDWR